MATVVERLRADLTVAMKARETARVAVLRTALAAIANAEAPPIDSAPLFAGAGPTEHRRLELTDEDLDTIIRGEIADRHDTIAQYERAGAAAPADELRAEIAVLNQYLV